MSNHQRTNEKFNNSYDNYNKGNQGKPICRSDCGRNHDEINDNLSEKANSVQTSYKYRKNKNGPNSNSSNQRGDDELSYEISENDNLICPNCINSTLMEDKQRREELERRRERDYDKNFDKNYGGGDYNNALYDRNRIYDRNLIDEKRRQREYNTNEAIQNLAKIKEGLSSKDKLIQINENSRNPLNDGYPDYRYQRFQEDYERRQKMINDNKSKYFPNASNERPEIKSYYDNYVYNPNQKYNYNKNEPNNGYDNVNKYGEYEPYNYGTNKRQYIKDLEDQINYKNELKKREKEEERRRGQKQFEEIQKDLKREEEERYMREKRKQDELIRANNELINQKNRMKLKDLEDKMKYRELWERQNEEYQKDLQRQQMEKERIKDDIYNHNKNEQMRREREREMEKEREREREMKEKYGKYGERYGPGAGYAPGSGGIYDDKFGEGGKYGDKFKPGEGGIYDDKYVGKYDKYDEKLDNRGGIGKVDKKYGERDKYGNIGDNREGKGRQYGIGDDRYDNRKKDNLGDMGYGSKGDGRYGDLGGNKGGIGTQGKVKERMGRCCRCHRIFPRRLLTINKYFYKENRK